MEFQVFRKPTKNTLETDGPNNQTLKYAKPKVLLVDLPAECTKALMSDGFNVKHGSLGSPYKVTVDYHDWSPLISNAALPNFTEQEIIFLDLTPPRVLKVPPESGERQALYCPHKSGVVDPRPLTVFKHKSDIDRILEHGGLIIIFAHPRACQTVGQVVKGVVGQSQEIEIWRHLGAFDNDGFVVEADHATELTSVNDASTAEILKPRLAEGAESTARLGWNWLPGNITWESVVLTKYDQCVGAWVSINDQRRILLLPQLSNKQAFIRDAMRELLPHVAPGLFPDFRGQAWVHNKSYELVEVLDLQLKKSEVVERVKSELATLDQQIVELQGASAFLYDLLTETGQSLVDAVGRVLREFGFPKVIDVDTLLEDGVPRQEDLRIEEQTPIVVVEVKGLSGLPTEGDAFQVVKYVSRRMRELGRTDIRGLVVVNHQRQLPPLERDNVNVFTDAQVGDAENNAFTLVTTWDLFRLFKAMHANGWMPKYVAKTLMVDGKVTGWPSHYKQIGTVAHTYPEAEVLSISLSDGELCCGDRVAFMQASGPLEQAIESMEVNNNAIDKAQSGAKVGIKSTFADGRIRKGTPVFLVSSSPDETTGEEKETKKDGSPCM